MRSIAADDIVILEGARTPIGKFLGSLKDTSATELGSTAAKAALQRAQVDPAWIDAVYVGNVIQSSKDAAYIARHIGINAGVPISTPALTLNRACASGLEAILQGARSLLLDEATFVLAGGAENMSMTPYSMRGVREGWRMIKTDVDDMLFSALHDPKAGCSIGETVEYLAQQQGISRQDADEIAVWGQQRAAQAQNNGIYAQEISPVLLQQKRKTLTIDQDENLRPDTNLASIAQLPPLFGADGVITAGNSSGLNDAAAMVVMTTARHARERGLQPLGRLLGWGIVGVEPKCMGLGPVASTQQALQRAGLTLQDIDIIELNDSFTVQYLAVERALGLDRNKVNVNGGAIALGHPMGATGTRLALTALYELRRRQARYALATLCVGGGQGVAAILEAFHN